MDKSGIIWIGCRSAFPPDDPKPGSGGLYRLNKKTGIVKRFIHDDKNVYTLIDNRVRAIFEDSRGVFWVGTAGDGLHIMDRNNETFQRLRYNPENPQQPSRPSVKNVFSYADDHITFINEDVKGQIWIGTMSGGISMYNPVTGSVQFYTTDAKEPFRLKNNSYWTCLKTKDNLLWVSIWTTKNDDPRLLKLSVAVNKINYSPIGKPVRSFAEDADSNIWIGTNNGFIKRTNNNKVDSFFVSTNKAAPNIVNNLENDGSDSLWISANSGLQLFNKKTKAFTSFIYSKENPNSISKGWVNATQKDGNDKLWIGTDNGLDLLDIKTGIFKHFKNIIGDSTSLSFDFINSIKRDHNGNIWVGGGNDASSLVYSSVLNKLDKKTGKFKGYLKDVNTVNCIYEDSRKRIWAGTYQYGLNVYDLKADNFIAFNDSTGLLNSNTNVYGITEDKQHNLWINSSAGYIQINPETKTAVLLGKSWGLELNNRTSQIFTSSKGELFFGDTLGFYHFFPQDITANKKVIPSPFISQFYLSDKLVMPGESELLPTPVSQTKEISLQYNQNNFAFEFNNIDFLTDESEKSMQFKLENYDDAWRKTSGDNRAFYHNVPPGKYVFNVRALNLYGSWGEKSLAVIVNPPWWKTWWAYTIYSFLFIVLAYSFHRYQKEKVIKAERERTRAKELALAKEIEKAYHELKTTQQQLIQSEKMASLGELTAGIAHEIQNPLNFVNNFSDVNRELLIELKEEADKGNINEVKSFANNVIDNEGKINHHGKRADAIVKGMLQHSRMSSGQKELTDINALADEYLRLSFHGVRAKDKSFNATIQTDFDSSIGKINVIPQDIGRVLLNLYNNAFYAVNEKAKLPGVNYQPAVSVMTKRKEESVFITVSDNGKGIPQNIVEKIFQPFFTTKPTGEGTGLGLSLSYDIIKAHGGEIKVETKKGEGSEFIIELPLK